MFIFLIKSPYNVYIRNQITLKQNYKLTSRCQKRHRFRKDHPHFKIPFDAADPAIFNIYDKGITVVPRTFVHMQNICHKQVQKCILNVRHCRKYRCTNVRAKHYKKNLL